MSHHEHCRLFAHFGVCADSGMAAAAHQRLIEAQDQRFNLLFCKAKREKNGASGIVGADPRGSEICVSAGD